MVGWNQQSRVEQRHTVDTLDTVGNRGERGGEEAPCAYLFYSEARGGKNKSVPQIPAARGRAVVSSTPSAVTSA